MAALLAVLALGLASCGGNDEGSGEGSSAAPGTTTVEERPDPDPAGDGRGPRRRVLVSTDPGGEPTFEQPSLEARRGQVRLQLRNPSTMLHSLCVESEDLGALGCTSQIRDDATTLTLDLDRGDYAFFCNVPGHREAGMEGALAVR